MSLFLIIQFILGFSYLSLFVFYSFGFKKALKIKHEAPEIIDNKSDYSIIIPFRNENYDSGLSDFAQSISALFFSKDSLNHIPEVLFIDDNSTDGSGNILESFSTKWKFKNQILKSEGQGKKEALQTGINHSISDKWIVTTDADVNLNYNWLKELDKVFSSTKAEMILMSITLKSWNFFTHLQKMESAALVSISAGSLMNGIPFSANGANLAFTKSIFEKVGGYAPEIHKSSGDDEYLMKRVFKYDKSLVDVYFTQDVTVGTPACRTFKELLNQRVRWSSKSSFKNFDVYQIPNLVLVLYILFLFLAIVLYFFTNIEVSVFRYLCFKWIGDLILFSTFAKFFKYDKKKQLTNIALILLMPFYQLFYMIPVMVLRMFGKYKWKGRKYGA